MEFRGKYWFLSNMYPCPKQIYYQGTMFPCVETAFQAAKGGRYWFPEFKNLDGKAARDRGRRMHLPDNWYLVRDGIMEQLVRDKFHDVNLQSMLISTYPEEIVEDNYWGDDYWGRYNGKGENKLGKILMKIRDELLDAENKEDKSMDTKFAVIVAGSRTFNNYGLFTAIMDKMLVNFTPSEITIISGGAKGADSLAERYANERNIRTIIMPANWDKYGKSAGYRRNAAMHKRLQDFEKKGCLCFWDGSSRGTKHNFELCEANGTPLRVFNFVTNRYMQKEELI